MSWLLTTSTSHKGLIPWVLFWSLSVATNALNLQSLSISALLGFCLVGFLLNYFWFVAGFLFNFLIFSLWLLQLWQLKPWILSAALLQLSPPGLPSTCCRAPPCSYLWLHFMVAKAKLFAALCLFLPPPFLFSEQFSLLRCLNCDFIPISNWNLLKMHNWKERGYLPFCLGECEAWAVESGAPLCGLVWSKDMPGTAVTAPQYHSSIPVLRLMPWHF